MDHWPFLLSLSVWLLFSWGASFQPISSSTTKRFHLTQRHLGKKQFSSTPVFPCNVKFQAFFLTSSLDSITLIYYISCLSRSFHWLFQNLLRSSDPWLGLMDAADVALCPTETLFSMPHKLTKGMKGKRKEKTERTQGISNHHYQTLNTAPELLNRKQTRMTWTKMTDMLVLSLLVLSQDATLEIPHLGIWYLERSQC